MFNGNHYLPILNTLEFLKADKVQFMWILRLNIKPFEHTNIFKFVT